MKQLKIETTTKSTTEVTLDGLDIEEVIRKAADLAHYLLEELSMYRQENGIEDFFACEGEACAFLDLIDD